MVFVVFVLPSLKISFFIYMPQSGRSTCFPAKSVYTVLTTCLLPFAIPSIAVVLLNLKFFHTFADLYFSMDASGTTSRTLATATSANGVFVSDSSS